MGSCRGCGSSSGDDRMRITAGGTYRRSWTWTRKANGAVVPLVDTDWTAELVIRRSLSYPTEILTVTSAPPTGLTLVTVTGEEPDVADGSLRIYLELLADVTATLDIGKNFRYTLALTNIANPDDVKVFDPGYVDITDTAL